MTKNSILAGLLCLLPLPAAADVRNISLEECLEMSRTGSPAVLNASLEARAARMQKQEALTMWFPNVSASAYAFHSVNPLLRLGLDDVAGSGDAANNLKYYADTMFGIAGADPQWTALDKGYIASLNVSQPLFAGGRIANGNALASVGVSAADAKCRMAERDNEDEIVRKYWFVVSLSEKKAALQQGIDLVASLEKDVASAFSAGLVRESDVMQVRLKARELETQMIQLRSGERLAKMDLFNSVGMEYRVLELDSLFLSDGFGSLLPPDRYYADGELVAASLDESRLLSLAVEAKKIERKMAVGETLPQIGIGASLGYGKIIGDPSSNAAVYAMVKVPLSDWWRNSRKIRRCGYEVEKAENDRAFLQRQLLLKVNKEWIELQCAWEKKCVAEEAVRLAEDMLSKRRIEYESGLCTLSELLQSQTGLQTARSSLVDAEAEYCDALSVWRK